MDDKWEVFMVLICYIDKNYRRSSRDGYKFMLKLYPGIKTTQ